MRTLRWPLSRSVTCFAAMILVVGAGGASITYLMIPPPKVPAKEIATPRLRVAGQDLDTTGDVTGRALDLVRRYAVGDAKLRLPNGKEVKLTRSDFGIEIDRARLSQFIQAAQEKGGVIARGHALGADPAAPIDVPLPLHVDTERAVAKLIDIKIDLDTLPVDAMIDLHDRKVRPEKPGYRLDVYATIAKIEEAFRSGQTVVDAAVEEVPPTRTAKELDGIKFDHVLGYFETSYNLGKKFEDRDFNLKTAASKVDGKVVMPGEVFDFNAVVGPRDEAHGYHVAKVIAEGELVDGIGGGTCQISGTLHGAAFFAGLDIVERYPHSRPSAYIPLGLDATVAYPNITYRFRNPFDFPIVLHEELTTHGGKDKVGTVRAEILGPERKLTVSYFRRVDEVLPFEEVERETPKLKSGARVVVQRGIPGFRATASRVVRDGAYAERNKWIEKYPPTVQIVDVGKGDKDTKQGVFEDPHPEYLVDEYRVITQGPTVKTSGQENPDGGVNDQRTPGRTGEVGWMRKLGFEKTPVDSGSQTDDDDDSKKDEKKKPKKKKKKPANG